MRETRTVIGSVCLAAALAAAPAAVSASAKAKGSYLGDEVVPERGGAAAVQLESVEYRPGEKGTDLRITGSAPFMYTSYESSQETLVIDLPGVGVGDLADLEVGTPEVSGVVVLGPDEVEGGRYARLEIHKGPMGGKAKASMDPSRDSVLNVFVPRLADERRPAARVAALREQEQGAEGAGFDPAEVLAAHASAGIQPASNGDDATPEVRLGRDAQDPRPTGPAASELTDVRIGQMGDALSIDLVTDGVVEYSSFELQDPHRVVIDLRGIHERIPPGTIRVGSSGVEKVRIAQYMPDPDPVVRVVLDADQALAHRIQRSPKGLSLFVSKEAKAVAQAASAARASRPGSTGSAGSGSGATPTGETLLASAEELGREEDAEQWEMDGDFGGADDLYETQTGVPEVEVPASLRGAQQSFETRVIGGEEVRYTGRPISLDLREAPIVDIFRLFHEISGLNIVVDPSVGNRTITIDVDNVPWDQVLDLILKTHGLGKTFDGNVLRIAPASKLAQEEREQQALREAKQQSQPLKTVTRTLSYARAEEVESIVNRIVRTAGGAGGQAVSIVDTRTNTLIIKDTEENIGEITELIDTLDVPSRQVMIEARIVETQKNFSQEFGIQWGFNYIASPEFGNQTDFAFPNSVVLDGATQGGADQGLGLPLGGYAVNLPAQSINSAIGISLGNILNTFQLDIALMALETKGKARVISAPRIIAQNNEAASIESGVQIPIVSTTAAEIDVSFVSASLALDVTPQITKEDTVILELTVENNSPSQVINVGDVPGITTRQAETTVLVQNGGTTVIGGIYQVNEGVNQSRTPFLHRIPLLGWLFKNKRKSTDNNELLIFITPRILN